MDSLIGKTFSFYKKWKFDLFSIYVLIFSSFFLLLSNAVTLRRDKSILFSRSSILSFIYCNSLTLNIIYLLSLAKGISLYGGLFHISSLTQIFYIFIFWITICILQLTAFYPRKITTENLYSWFSLFSYKLSLSKIVITNIINKMANQFKIIEYSLIIIFIIIGATFLMSANDLVSIFLAIELQSYGLYLLSTLYRDSEKATSGGLTYFLLGGLSSCLILLGTGLLYIYSGTTSLDVLYGMTSISEITYNNFFNQYNAYYINFSFIVISVGFLFKTSAAPFHFWSPDVYDAIPTIVTTFVAIIAKISILLFFLELIHYTSDLLFMYKYNWTNSILLSCLLSLIIGTLLGLSQSRIKRLFAYSTISHIGFILLALAINSIESTQAFIFYLMQYSVSNLNAFIILLAIGFSLYYFVYDNKVIKVLPDKNNSPIQLINQLKGYFYINPIISLAFAITIFSFVGIPPLLGFFAKQMVLSAALDSGYIFLTFVAILTSVIGAVYYLGIIKQMFFDKNEYILSTQLETDDFKLKLLINSNNKNKQYIYINIDNIVISSYLSITISILTLIILLFILTPQEWLSMANIVALILFNS